jgi:hypothetical protein
MKTIANLQDINNDSINKMNDAVDAIEKLMADPATSLDDESRLIARRATLHAQINNQSLIQAHLKVANVIVGFDPNDEQDLDGLNATMDGYILSGLKVNAMLALVPTIVDTAIGIGNAITSHTGQN